MTGDELRAKYKTLYKILDREKRMREHVFRNDPVALRQKVGEIDRGMEILTEFKDELKRLLGAAELEQPTLLDVPEARRAEYQ